MTGRQLLLLALVLVVDGAPARLAEQSERQLGPVSHGEIDGVKLSWAVALLSPDVCAQCWCNCGQRACQSHLSAPAACHGAEQCLASLCRDSEIDVVGGHGVQADIPPSAIVAPKAHFIPGASSPCSNMSTLLQPSRGKRKKRSDSSDASPCPQCANPTPRDVDAVICPVLATAIRQGKLPADADGWVTFSDLDKLLIDGFGLPHGLGAEGRVNLFELDGNEAFEHGVSSGIRDPRPNRTAFDKLLTFAKDGIFTSSELMMAGHYFDQHPNPESHTPAGVDHGGFESTLLGAFLPIFGRCGPEERETFFGPVGSRYPNNDYVGENTVDPPVACTPTNLFMTVNDMERIFWLNRFPQGFKLKYNS